MRSKPDLRLFTIYTTVYRTVLIYLYTMILIYYIVIILLCAHTAYDGWFFFYILIYISLLYNAYYMGGRASNPRSEIPVRRPHADANRPGTSARAMVRKNASTLLGIFSFIILQMSSSARGGRYYDGGLCGGEGLTKRTIQHVLFVNIYIHI